MKKVFSILLALVMTMSLCATSFAADSTTYSITIKNDVEGHTYEAYQIMTGDLATKDGNEVLSNVQWGSNAKQTGAVSDAILKNMTVEEAASYVDFTTNPVATSTYADGKYTISGLAAGYYLVKDKDNSISGDDTYTSYIIQVLGTTEIAPKGDKPSVEKKVKDTNDSTGATTDWQDSADYDIGDTIPYQLTGTLPTNYAEYKQYYYKFTDTMSAGLTYKNDAKVYVVKGESKIDITEKCSIVSNKNAANETVLTVSIDDLKVLGVSIDKDSKIVVEYSAILNDQAKIGADGNPNVVDLTYSNNPNQQSGGTPDTGKTLEDKVIVFTYELDANKYANEVKAGNELPGAGFTLYKKDAATNEYKAVGEEVTGEGMTKFIWTGLDDGEYKLVETTTPAGYNTMKPVEFTISAEHDSENVDPKLSALSCTLENFEATLNTGVIEGNIINQSGATLPETGGIGTYIFYAVGGLLLVGAAVMLVAKKRMEGQN